MPPLPRLLPFLLLPLLLLNPASAVPCVVQGVLSCSDCGEMCSTSATGSFPGSSPPVAPVGAPELFYFSCSNLQQSTAQTCVCGNTGYNCGLGTGELPDPAPTCEQLRPAISTLPECTAQCASLGQSVKQDGFSPAVNGGAFCACLSASPPPSNPYSSGGTFDAPPFQCASARANPAGLRYTGAASREGLALGALGAGVAGVLVMLL